MGVDGEACRRERRMSMKLREFNFLLGGAAATWPLIAFAQQAKTSPRIGVLWHANNEEEEGEYFTTIIQGFRDLGYVEGRNISFFHRYAGEQYDRFKSLAEELVALKVDVLVAVTRPAAVAAQAATATIPIVFVVVPNPVSSKLIDSLAKPGRNITGLSSMSLDVTAKRLELLKDMAPGLTRAALLVNPSDAAFTDRVLAEVTPVANQLGVVVQPFEARTPEQITQAFAKISQNNMHGIFSGNDPMFHNERKRIAGLALENRTPIVLQNRMGAAAGAFMSYGPNSAPMFYRAATYVDKVIKGQKPGDIPVEQPTKFELLVNLKTAAALGITVPPTLLARADEVIE
jgi:putative tryptophan/tyrosine transport system substrate-binding protein